jgi:hypothetical protein
MSATWALQPGPLYEPTPPVGPLIDSCVIWDGIKTKKTTITDDYSHSNVVYVFIKGGNRVWDGGFIILRKQ